jgi:coenzyme F420-reducing hydrogenase beta subunit
MDKHRFEIELASQSVCTGCRACLDVCPTNSITFTISDDSLHAFPSINSVTCIQCHRCEKVCVPLHPERIKKDEHYVEKYYLGYNTNKEERFLSTSGGVGGALADYALNLGFYVVGAEFDKDWHLYHKVSKEKGALSKIRGSKYMLSDMTGVYSKILSLVKSQEKVLFIGTPCQIQALLNIIPDVYKNNIVTCGIICHGVNSPLVWNDFVSYLESKYKSHLRTYNFRSKAKGWGKLWIDFSFDNGKVVSQPAGKNLFHVWFGRHYILRKSCFHCLFRK